MFQTTRRTKPGRLVGGSNHRHRLDVSCNYLHESRASLSADEVAAPAPAPAKASVAINTPPGRPIRLAALAVRPTGMVFGRLASSSLKDTPLVQSPTAARIAPSPAALEVIARFRATQAAAEAEIASRVAALQAAAQAAPKSGSSTSYIVASKLRVRSIWMRLSSISMRPTITTLSTNSFEIDSGRRIRKQLDTAEAFGQLRGFPHY